ncbi:DUF2100 domain-containing protein [Methanobacterium alcaliphilum]|uniref:DUF2100 domain-containing protein n=1 Tax=Methanobacterium alcaliphilum TaxID=392018 RepID=UPI00200A8633|nr:DUF2100 domain-containing protein [Methanobacterium alcaliphilum]MCK9151505.1 DUF2100 domain-containing protein [Methanobacterium alcaliphilum]
MDIRTKQAENLIIKAGKSTNQKEILKDPQKGIIDVKLFEKALKNLIETEEFIYSSLPSHELNSEESKKFTQNLLEIRADINSMLSDFGVIEKADEKVNISELSQKFLIITTKNNFKKALQKLGVDVQQIVVASVPLEIDDMKKINPKIPEAALKGINKKIEHVKNDIQRKTEKLGLNEILVLVEADVNGEVLGERAKEHYNAHVAVHEKLKDISSSELIEIFNKTLS